MTAFLNLGALVLGIAAWILPLAAIHRRKRDQRSIFLSVASFSACALALVLQFFEFRQRVRAEDWSALMYTIDATIWVSILLVAGTVLLNILAVKRKGACLPTNRMKGTQ